MFEDLIQELWKAIVIGGGICVVGQLLFDICKLTPAHTMSVFVILGSILGIFGWYQKLGDFAGMGAKLPIVSFGNVLVEGAKNGATADGFWGILTGMLTPVSAGITAAVVFGFIVAVVFKPKS